MKTRSIATLLALVALAALVAGACGGVIDTGQNAAGTGGGASAVQCPQEVCTGEGSCLACAEAGPCASVWQTCLSNPACESIRVCWLGCGRQDADCQQGCIGAHPTGADTYNALNQCVFCQNCMAVCGVQC